jgi:protoporphyrinogen oxidase
LSVVIVGAGIAGISAGLALREARRDFLALEAEDGPGGLLRTDEAAGFRFDRTGHFLHFKGDLLSSRLAETRVPLESIERRSAVLVGDKVVPYPIQYNLWALDSSALAEKAVEEVLAHGEASEEPRSLAELLLTSWGSTLYELFFRPYNEKLWGRPLEDLPADCVGGYLPTTDVELAAQGAKGPTSYDGYNGHFSYPASGRIGDVADALAAPLGEQVLYERSVVAIDLGARVVETADGEVLPYETLISTLPLDQLLVLAGERPAPRLFEATEILNVRIGFRGAMRVPLHWVYVPDAGVPFHRIGFPGNVNARTCPPGCASVSVEYTHPRDDLPLSGEEIAASALEYLDDLGFFDIQETLAISEHLLSPAYVVHRSPGRAEFEVIRELLAEGNVLLAGRFGTWDYFSIEESFDSGWRVGTAVREETRV